MNKKSIISVFIVFILVGFSLGCTSSDSDSSSNETADAVELKDVSVSSDYFDYPELSGNAIFKKDHSYASINADIHLTDDSVDTSYAKSWNDVKAGTKYTLGGSMLTSHKLSEIKSIDFKYNNKVVYTWKNE
ncbi:MAG: conserved hypothetical protein [Methanobrevibacter sp. CfCl-M3]